MVRRLNPYHLSTASECQNPIYEVRLIDKRNSEHILTHIVWCHLQNKVCDSGAKQNSLNIVNN